MKILIATLAVLFRVGTIAAQEIPHDSQRHAVAEAVQQLHQAMVTADSSRLRSLTAEELTYGHSTGVVEDRQAFIDSVLSRKPDYAKIEFDSAVITVKGDVACVRGTLQAKLAGSHDGNDPNQIVFKILYVFIKERGTWKLLARQAVK